MRKVFTWVALFLAVLAFPLNGQTRDSLVSSKVDSIPKVDTVWQKLFTNTYIRVAAAPVPPVDTAKPPPSSGLGNLKNVDFEDGTFGGLTDGGGGKPVNATIVSSGCFAGTKCFDVNISSTGTSDNGGSGYWTSSNGYSDLWVSYALNILRSPTSGGVQTQKMLIFRNNGNQGLLGEFVQAYGGWAWSWLFTESGPNYPVTPLGPTTTPGWHRYKVHFHCAKPATVSIGMDGKENVWVKPTAGGGGCASLPTTLTFGGTLNAGSGTSHFQFDNIHIGTVDPGWP